MFLSTRTKSISNKLDIDGLVQDCSNSIAYALELLQSCTKPSIWLSVGSHNVLHNQLWFHHENINRARETGNQFVHIIFFIIINGLVPLCKNKVMYVLFWWNVYAPTGVLFWFPFFCFTVQEINNKIWKQFATSLHMLFAICNICLYNCIECINQYLFHRDSHTVQDQ